MDMTTRDAVLTIVGGSFNSAALGPEQYEELAAEARAHADEYLDEFETLFLGERFDALTHSSLLLPVLLELLADTRPDRVNELALRLLRQYDALLVIPDAMGDREAVVSSLPEDIARLWQRLNERRSELREIVE
jgi:hypothetical protein